MDKANLFRLGTDLGTGTTQTEDTGNRGHLHIVETAAETVMDTARDDHFVRTSDAIYAGTHLIIEVTGAEGLDDEDRIQTAFRDCVEACGATLLHIHTHKFSPQGVSGVAVLAESHISVHTWPEVGYGAFDVFMCGEADPWQAVDVLRRAFSAREVQVKELRRGEGIIQAEA